MKNARFPKILFTSAATERIALAGRKGTCTMLLSPLLLAFTFHAGAASRRDLLKGIGVAPAAVTMRLPPAVAPAPIAPVTAAVTEGYVQTRADLIRFLFASTQQRQTNQNLPSLGTMLDGGEDPWAGSPLKKIERKPDPWSLRNLDPDVTRDWTLATSEGASLAREVEEYWRVVETLDATSGPPRAHLRDRHDELRDVIWRGLTRPPWSTMDWHHVFAERIASAELNVFSNAGLGLALEQVRALTQNLLYGLDYYQAMATRGPAAQAYTTEALTAIIAALKDFAPHAGERLNDQYLVSFPHLSFYADEISHYRLSRDDGMSHKSLSNTRLQQFFASDQEAEHWASVFSGANNIPMNFRGFDRFAAGMPAAYREHIGVLRRIIANVRTHPPTASGEAFITELERRLLELEFELTTLPRRLRAFRLLVTVHQKTTTGRTWHLSTEANSIFEHAIPSVHSRAWLRWRPSRVTAIKPTIRDYPAVSTAARAALPELASVEYLNLAWLRSLLGAEFTLSEQALEWLAGEEFDVPEPAALTHQPVEPVVACDLILGEGELITSTHEDAAVPKPESESLPSRESD